MTAQIRPNRLEVNDRFPVLGFTIRTDEPQARAEVAVATEPSLFLPEMKEKRTVSTFYSSRASGQLILPRGEAVYLIPPDAMARFVGQDRLYVGLAVTSKTNGTTPKVIVVPTEGSAYISLKGLTGRSLSRVRVLPRTSQRRNGFSPNDAAALEWAGDTATPQLNPVGNGTANYGVPSNGAKQGSSMIDQSAPGSQLAPGDYDDGFGPMPERPEKGTAAAPSQTNGGASTLGRQTVAAGLTQNFSRVPAKPYAAPRPYVRSATAGAQSVSSRRQPPLAQAQEIVTPFYDPADPASALTCQNDAFSLAREEWFAGVPNTSIFPHSAICQLQMTGPDGSTYQGTGFYIARDRILTCAHNLNGMSSVTIIPGRNGVGSAPFGQRTVSSSSWRVAPAYTGNGNWNNDLAVIDNVPLPAPNGQWFRFINATPSHSLPIVVCGYSAGSRAVPELTEAIDGDKQHLHGGYATEQSNAEVIEYPILTLMGASGSPVYHLTDRSGALEALVCAVHVTGEPAAQGLNRGCFITPTKIDWIEGRSTAFSLGSRALEIPLDPGVGGMSIGVDAMQPADIIVSTMRSPISYAIRAGTLSAVSHAMLYVGNGNVIEAVGSGVREVSIGEAIGNAILAVAYRDPRVNAPLATAIVDHARARVGDPYNYAGVSFTGYRILNPLPARIIDSIASRFGLEVGQAGAVYCSELVLESFEHAGIPLVSSRPGASNPDDLLQLRDSLLSYVGHLKGEDVPLGIPLGLGQSSSARRATLGRAADAGVNGGEVLMPKPPPPRARGLSGAEAAIAIGGFLLETVRDSSGDVTWELDQFANRKHPNDTAPADPPPYHDAATIRLDSWPVSGGLVDDISAWFSIDWQYNGRSLGNVRIGNIGTNDAAGWSLHVRAQIMDDNILYDPDQCAALRVRFHYRFSRGIGADNIAVTEVHLFGDGTYASSSQWIQSSVLSLGQSARNGGKPSSWALDGGTVVSAIGIIVGAVTSSSGDVSWELDAFNQIKHPNDVAPQKPGAFRSAPPIKIEDWSMGFLDEIGADFAVNWQYNGTSIGNIDITNVYVNDAIGMSLDVKATITHDNTVYDNRAAIVHVRPDGQVLSLLNADGTAAAVDTTRQRCAAMRIHFDFTWNQTIGPAHKAAVDLHLFGDGTYTRFGRWIQHSFL